MFDPRAMAMLTRRRTSSMASASAGPPPAGSNSPSMANASKPGVSPCSLTYTSLARSSLSMTGYGRMIWRLEPGVGCSTLPSGPSLDRAEVTSSSRMASSGGLVTWAKSWVK